MNDDLRRRIEYLQEKKSEIDAIKTKMDGERFNFDKYFIKEKNDFEVDAVIKRRTLEESIASDRRRLEARYRVEMYVLEEKLKPLKEEYKKLSNILMFLEQSTVSVRLGDLMEELVSLTGIAEPSISINTKTRPIFTFSGKCSKEVSKLINTMNHGFDIEWMVLLHGKRLVRDPISFTYLIKSTSNLTDIQSDGKTLLEHCTVDIEFDALMKRYYTNLYVGKNIDDLVLNILLSDLVREDTVNWYPADVITQAIINCVEKSQEKEVSKKISRKLSDETNK